MELLQCLLLATCGFCVVHAAPLMGSTQEFPPRYHTSVRGLSETIRAARPQSIDQLKFDILHHDPKRKLLKASILGSDLNLEHLKQDITRIERHFRRIAGMKSDRNLAAFTPVQGIEDVDMFRLTAYAGYYNIFYLDSTAVGQLYWTIKALFHQHAIAYGLDLNRTYFMHGWFNCFRGGGRVSLHSHCFGVAGNFALNVPPASFTRYASYSKDYKWLQKVQQDCKQEPQRKVCGELSHRWPYAGDLLDLSTSDMTPVTLSNTNGEMVMFHGLVEHESSNVTQEMRQQLGGRNACRMTIGFDIDTDPTDLHHSVPLYDPSDPWWSEDAGASLGERVGEKVEQMYREAKVPAAFDWDTVPDSRGKEFQDRMHAARLHEGSDLVAAWSKQQARQGWSGSCPRQGLEQTCRRDRE